ncbi:MAG: guanylate kinase [Gemmatimonadetes bacterium]|nr:guanylate kinase [Gemmatimonadota bacterium]
MVISAPSGAGKTTLARALVERQPGVVFSISATTRPARPHEREARDYAFVDDAEFDRMVAAGELAEWAVVHGRRYGTPRAEIEKALARGEIVVLDIDVQGARQIRAAFPEALLVFVLPPSVQELDRRLACRGSEAEEERRRRLVNARIELAAASEFDYLVVNEELETAVQTLEAVLLAERHRAARSTNLAAEIREMDRELARILERSA